eukprot:337897_1
MIYCNYTHLQYIFSKTYRENKGNNHCYFYFLGKYLKIALHHFSSKISNQTADTFYHGISRTVYFPQYINSDRTRGLSVNGPLSTSSSFEVACNFAQHAGLIIELKQDSHFQLRGYLIIQEKHAYSSLRGQSFSAAWLSNYPGEKEYLFAQNLSRLLITNIIELKTGYEYKYVLTATTLIHSCVNKEYNDSKHIDDKMQLFCQMVLEHQLAKTSSHYKSFTSLNAFSKQILNTLFLKQQIIYV